MLGALVEPSVAALAVSLSALLDPSVSVSIADAIQPAFLEGFVSTYLGDDWQFVYRNADYLLWGAGVTVLLTLTSILLGFIAGFPAGAIEVYGSGYSKAFVRKTGVLIRGTPILVIMIFTYFVLPIEIVLVAAELGLRALEFVLGPTPVAVPTDVPEAFIAATIALGFRSAAYQSQIFRGALQSVDDGQMEAARSIGMSRLEAIRHVMVPQAMRRSVPGFQNEFTIVLKDTSIAFAIGLGELLKRSHDLFIQETTAVLEVIIFISLIYFVLTFGTNRLLDYLSYRFAIPGEST
ncbi:amino acid ABC transporter permease [Natrarchaeobaculum sulfurireducens]|uniref:Polar amino acid ABC transporter, inner membrane subunit n=1 Tax=Natrarchaeobaculum sulfurireducens TaxID=2044521 RepID=A0A346PLD0_9EURY|nr:amino acid ABC transporter permease [Natrarchaeobaculum sulfurireducens]AXR80325.1 polar amino acid ABC transporter, inner membrane subunit [Natrarchaeobaculum sulfurireducens]